MDSDPTKAQEMMIADGLPAAAIISQEERAAAWKGRRLTKPRDLKAPAKNEDPATKALRKEIAKAAEQKKAERFARLTELKATTTKQAAKPAGQETTMAKTTKKTPAKKAVAKPPAAPRKAKATEAPAAGERADGLRAGSKQAIMLDMVRRPEGASEAEICKALGWKKCRVTLKRVCEKVGAKLASDKVDGTTVYKVAA